MQYTVFIVLFTFYVTYVCTHIIDIIIHVNCTNSLVS